MSYAAGRRDESPVYDDCPTHCDMLDEDRTSFCGSCPVGIARAEFENEAKENLKTIPGNRFEFDYLYRCLIEVQNAGDLPPELETVTTARLRAIVDAERNRIDRIERWNKQQTTRTPGEV